MTGRLKSTIEADRWLRLGALLLLAFVLQAGVPTRLGARASRLTPHFSKSPQSRVARDLPGSALSQRLPTLRLLPTTRLLVVAPHPDDEILGAGGLLQEAVRTGIPSHVAFVTSGDGYPDAVKTDFRIAQPTPDAYLAMGELRQEEARRALEILGLGRDEMSFLGFPDGGLMRLWRDHYPADSPYQSPYTRQASPPYQDSVDPTLDYVGADLVEVLGRVLRSNAPNLIVVPHPGDQHPDHAAAGRFAIEAIEGLQEQGVLRRDTEVVTYLVHHGLWPDGTAGDTELLAPRPEWVPHTRWSTFPVAAEQRIRKELALRAYDSQMNVMADFLLRFARSNELFGELPQRMEAQIAEFHDDCCR